MKVTLLLADSAQAVEGKLFILGGGWSVTGPAPVPSALAIKIEVPWSEANRRHRWVIRLHDADGEIVSLPTPDGSAGVEIDGEFEVGRPPGALEGVPLDFPLAVNLGPIPLDEGRYTWRLYLNDHTEGDWHVSFSVRPPTGP